MDDNKFQIFVKKCIDILKKSYPNFNWEYNTSYYYKNIRVTNFGGKEVVFIELYPNVSKFIICYSNVLTCPKGTYPTVIRKEYSMNISDNELNIKLKNIFSLAIPTMERKIKEISKIFQ